MVIAYTDVSLAEIGQLGLIVLCGLLIGIGITYMGGR